MTDEELEFESFSYRKDHLLSFKFTEKEAMAFDFGYVKGARNHGIVWHDLRKNPEDLPEERHDVLCFVIHNEHRYYLQGYYNGGAWGCTPLGTFLNEEDVKAWCELLKFTEE